VLLCRSYASVQKILTQVAIRTAAAKFGALPGRSRAGIPQHFEASSARDTHLQNLEALLVAGDQHTDVVVLGGSHWLVKRHLQHMVRRLASRCQLCCTYDLMSTDALFNCTRKQRLD